MLYLKDIYIENFCNISKAKLNLDSNVILLSGCSGQGKSSVIDAIALCVSNKRRAGRYSDYIKQGEKSARVTLNATLLGNDICFDLKIGKYDDFTIDYKNQKYKKTEATEFLSTFDFNYYSNIMFSLQNDQDITQLNPTQRSDYLKKLLNFDFSNEIETVSSELATLQENLSSINLEVDSNNLLIKSYRSNIVRVVKNNNIDDELKKLESFCSELQNKLTELQRKNTLKNQILSEITLKEKRINEIQLSVERLKSRVGSLKEAASRTEELNLKIEEHISRINKTNEIICENKQKLTVVENEMLGVEQIILTDEKTLDLNKSIYNECVNYKKLYDEGKCPHCGQNTTEFIDKCAIEKYGTAALEDVLLGFKNNVDSSTLKVREAKSKLNNKTLEKNSIEGTINFSLKEKKRVEDELKKLENTVNKESIEQNLKDIDSLNNDLEQFYAELKNINVEVDSLKKSDICVDDTSLSEYTDQIISVRSQINELENKKTLQTQLQKNNEIFKEKISVLETKNNKLSSDKTTIENEINVKSPAIDILKRDLPNYLIVKTGLILQDEMNSFIHNVFPEYKVLLQNDRRGVTFFYSKDEKMPDSVNNKWLDARMSSGYEKALLSMAFKVALCKLYGLNFCVLDEVESSADKNSSETFIRSLIDSCIFDQIIMISHKPELVELISDISENSLVYSVKKGQFSAVDYND